MILLCVIQQTTWLSTRTWGIYSGQLRVTGRALPVTDEVAHKALDAVHHKHMDLQLHCRQAAGRKHRVDRHVVLAGQSESTSFCTNQPLTNQSTNQPNNQQTTNNQPTNNRTNHNHPTKQTIDSIPMWAAVCINTLFMFAECDCYRYSLPGIWLWWRLWEGWFMNYDRCSLLLQTQSKNLRSAWVENYKD